MLILLFGTLTLVLQDDRFIKWKPTVLYGAMALALAIAVWGMKKNILQMLLGSQLTLPEGVEFVAQGGEADPVLVTIVGPAGGAAAAASEGEAAAE